MYSLENPNEEYSQDNLPKGTLLYRDKDYINMGTYNYGDNGATHFLYDMVKYNWDIFSSKGNVGEDAGFAIPKELLDVEENEKANLSQEKIIEFIERE